MLLNSSIREASVYANSLGAGSGGASTAYYLHRSAYPCKVNVTVYERADYIGGRSTTVGVYGDPLEPVELGASIFVKVNRNLVSAVDRFNLSTLGYAGEDLDGITKALGIWNGKGFIFVQSDGSYGWWNNVKLVWKYGMSPVRTQRLMKDTVGRFLAMYDAPNFPFRSISDTAFNLGLKAPTIPSEQLLAENSIYAPFSTDIIQASTRVNYAQNLAQIHGLEAMVCMAANGAMSVYGGNWQIFDRMLRYDKNAVLLNTTVTSVTLNADEQGYAIKSVSASGHSAEDRILTSSTEDYDTVVIAGPLQFANISISPRPANPPSPVHYVTLYVTLFTSPYRPSPARFGLRDPSEVPTTILTTLPPDGQDPPPFFSLSTLRTITNLGVQPSRREYLYKLFSHDPANSTFLSGLLDVPEVIRSLPLSPKTPDIITWQYNKTWNSYPYLPPRATFDDPQLDEGGRLYYTSGIEPFISTMETSSLMGKNVAQLIVNRWGYNQSLAASGTEREEQPLARENEFMSEDLRI